ncbi:MAG: 50S ribosomal protein L5 [Patescibacteria group bacterium]
MEPLQERYKKEILPKLMHEFSITNPMAVPRLVKIVVNCGIGEAVTDKKVVEKVAAQLAVITGQKPQITRAKRAISTFKLRAGDPVGLRVTLRGKRMWDFFLKLVMVAIPRVRDFHGVPLRGFDQQGNYTLGIAEQTIFPELDYQLVDKVRGFEITFVTNSTEPKVGRALLAQMGMPFEKE